MTTNLADYWRLETVGDKLYSIAQYPRMGVALDLVEDQMMRDGPGLRHEAFDSLQDDDMSWIGRTMPDGIRQRLQLVYGVWDYAMTAYVKPCIERLQGAKIEIESVRRQQQWLQQADEVDYDRMRWSGRSDFWRGTSRVARVHTRAVTLVCPVFYSAKTPAKTISYHAAATATLVDLMEAAGYRVRLSFVSVSKPSVKRLLTINNRPQKYLMEFPVKDTHEPLILPTVINTFSPWFYRQHEFALADCGPFYTVDRSIGMPARLDEKLDTPVLFPGQEVVVLHAPNIVAWGLDDAEKWVRASIEKIEAAAHAELI